MSEELDLSPLAFAVAAAIVIFCAALVRVLIVFRREARRERRMRAIEKTFGWHGRGDDAGGAASR